MIYLISFKKNFMLRILFGTFVLLHGLLHFMGFAKAFHYGNITGITRAISKTAGVLWLVTAMLFVLAILLFFLRNEGWWMIALPAVVMSQCLIIDNWQDARFGTIANLVIFVSCLLSFGSWKFERRFQKDIVENLNALPDSAGFFVMEKDLQSLPRYLRRKT